MNQNIWDQFANFDNFLLAWQRIVNNSSRIVQDELGLVTFSYNLEVNLYELIRVLQAEDFPYEPLADHKVYIPKPSTTLRTMSLMTIQDLIVYQALVNVVADQAHQFFVTHENQYVYGNLYAGAGKRWMLKRWRDQYNYFVKRIAGLYKNGNSWIASTDIVAFYDTIDHQRLLSLIKKYSNDEERFITLFRNCLTKWSAHNANTQMSRGIPQGSNASDFLANLFLYDIDREMIVNGYHYVRYVDDVRILGPDKSTVQKGLILFDLELKRAGLVAQVSKTSVHEIVDIEKEIIRLKFLVTDPTGEEEYQEVNVALPSKSDQAGSIEEFIQNTDSEQVTNQNLDGEYLDDEDEGENEPQNTTDSDNSDLDENTTENFQQQLRDKFVESLSLLDDPEKNKEAESSLTYCLNRLKPHEDIREQVIGLLYRLPWRSEAITGCLAKYKVDSYIINALAEFINKHDVYSWHRANALWALHQIGDNKNSRTISRQWLSDPKFDWYARTIAAKVLTEAPGQHAFLFETLKREQYLAKDFPEETAILRQQLAFGAFQRIKSAKKQLTLLNLICQDKSPIVRRLVIYLLQQPQCNVVWDDLKLHHLEIGELSELVKSLGISTDAPQLCFISQTLRSMYAVTLSMDDLRSLYQAHYSKAVTGLRTSVSTYHHSPSDYVRSFHQFAHLTLIAFYEQVLPSETGLYENYGGLTNRKTLTPLLPLGLDTWKQLGSMRNRVDHPVDSLTKTHSKSISVKEVEDLLKRLQVALQELFDLWLSSPMSVSPPIVASATVTSTTVPPVGILAPPSP